MKLVEAKASTYPRKYYYDGRRVPRKDSPTGKSRVYVDVLNETLLENFAARTSRPYIEWKPFVLEGLASLGIGNAKLRWSQKAGCSCPCSPGFFIDGHFGQDFWVTIDAEGTLQATDENEANARANALVNSF